MAMTEQQFEKDIQEVKQHLSAIRKNTRSPIWKSFVTGTLSGLGGVVGVAIALALLGWILNIIGVIPAFQQQANSWHQTLDNLRSSK